MDAPATRAKGPPIMDSLSLLRFKTTTHKGVETRVWKNEPDIAVYVSKKTTAKTARCKVTVAFTNPHWTTGVGGVVRTIEGETDGQRDARLKSEFAAAGFAYEHGVAAVSFNARDLDHAIALAAAALGAAGLAWTTPIPRDHEVMRRQRPVPEVGDRVYADFGTKRLHGRVISVSGAHATDCVALCEWTEYADTAAFVANRPTLFVQARPAHELALETRRPAQ